MPFTGDQHPVQALALGAGEQCAVSIHAAPLWFVARKNLTVDDLGDLLDEPLVAVLAILRTDRTVLLSPVCHEWRDGGLNVSVEEQNVKVRHLRRDPQSDDPRGRV